MRAVIVSDLHPDANTAGLPRFGDVEEALRQATAHALEIEADLMIFAGDLITNDPSIHLVIRCQMMLKRAEKRLWERRVPFLKIPGNHDVFEDGLGTTALDIFTHSVFHQPSLYRHDDGEYVGFLPFAATSHSYDPEEAIEEFHAQAPGEVKLIVGHLNLEGIAPGSEVENFPRGREVFFPIDKAKKMFPNAVLVNGHVHRRQVHRGVHVVGSLVPLTKGEVGNEPGFLVVEA